MHQQRKQTVIDLNQLIFIRNLLYFGGLSLTVVGTLMMIFNPQFTDRNQNTRIYEAGKSRLKVEIHQDKRSRNIGLGVAVAGGVMMGFSAAANKGTDIDKPKDLQQPLRTIETTPVAIEPSRSAAAQVQRTKQSFADALVNLITPHPWLLSCLQAPALVIVGQPGSGKSRLAMAIAYLQQIANDGAGIMIGDPDGLANMKKGTWLAGTVYGARATQAEQEAELLEAIRLHLDTGNRSEDDAWITTIWDEFSKWADDYPLVRNECTSVLKHGLQATRKRAQGDIFLIHDISKGMAGGDTVSGAWNSLLSYATVLYLPSPPKARKTTFGKPPRAETVWVKPSGQRFTSTDGLPSLDRQGGWEYYNLPQALDPAIFSSTYHQYLPGFGLDAVRTAADLKKANEQEDAEKLREEMKDAFPGFRKVEERDESVEKLEQLFDTELYGEDVDDTDVDELTPEQFQLIYLPAARSLTEKQAVIVKYFFNRKPDELEDGFLSIAKTYSNCAKNHDLSRPGLKDLLTEMEKSFLVLRTETHWKVRGLRKRHFRGV